MPIESEFVCKNCGETIKYDDEFIFPAWYHDHNVSSYCNFDDIHDQTKAEPKETTSCPTK